MAKLAKSPPDSVMIIQRFNDFTVNGVLTILNKPKNCILTEAVVEVGMYTFLFYITFG